MLKNIPMAFLHLCARAYAADPQGTEADLMWLATEFRYPGRLCLHIDGGEFDDICARLKIGSLSIELTDVRNAKSDTSEAVPTTG
jgi:hypothetical protein